MGLIITRRQWTQKPPDGMQINRGDPSAQRLVFAALPGVDSGWDASSGGRATLNSGGSWGRIINSTHTIDNDGSDGGGATFASNAYSMKRMSGDPCLHTIVWGMMVDTLELAQDIIFVPQTSPSQLFSIKIDTFNNTRLEYKAYKDAFTVRSWNIGGNVLVAGEYAQFAISRIGDTVYLYKNGAYIISAVSSGTTACFYSNASTVMLASMFDGAVAYCYFYDAALTPGEIARIHENPYRIFSTPRRYWIGVAAAGGETITLYKTAFVYTGKGIKLNERLAIVKRAVAYNGKSLKCNEIIHPVKATFAWTGESLKANEAIHPTKTALTWTGKPIKCSEALHAAKTALAWTGQFLKRSETIHPAKQALAWTGKPLTLAETLKLAKTSLVWTGKTLIIGGAETIELIKTALAWTGKTLNIRENLHLTKTALAWTGKTLTVLTATTLTLTKTALTWTGKTLKINEVVHLTKTALRWTGKAVSFFGQLIARGIGRLGNSLRLD